MDDTIVLANLRTLLENNLNQTLHSLKQNNEEIIQNKYKIKRSSGTVCSSGQVDNSIGNLGFNSFNFLTFMILTFNAITNVNNNINNNNNNNNDVSLNSISQTSSNTISNSDNSNDIMVMILPMPGGRKKRSLPKNVDGISDATILKEIWSSISNFINQSKSIDTRCEPYVLCKIMKSFQENIHLLDILFIDLSDSNHHPSLMSLLSCNKIFPHCTK